MKLNFRLPILIAALALVFPAAAQEKKERPKAPTAPIDAHYAIPATDDGLPGAGPIRRADWFQKLWGQRRTTWSKRVDQDKGAFVLLGDSITQGWEQNNMAESFRGVKVANRGISGDTTRGVLI